MKFSLYDVLSNLIPGYLILISLVFFIGYKPENLDIVASLVLAYIAGYVNNTLSSWSEGFIHWSWGGKPSDRLLEGKNIWKVSFYEYNKAKKELTLAASNSSPSNDELFQIALRYANSSGNEKVKEFNSSYAFARGLLIAFLIVSVIINVKLWLNIFVMGSSIILLFVFWLRAKQRGYYFVRIVLMDYLNKINK